MALFTLMVPDGVNAQQECGAAERPCAVADGSYQLFSPLTLPRDGKVKALVYFHGWRGTGAGVIGNKGLQEIATRYDLLLVAPNGRNRTWAHNGSPSQARDDLAFIDTVLEDIIDDHNVDPRRIYAAGFSQGGSMVWDLICRRPERFAGFAPIAGAFWHPQPVECDGGGRAPVVHYHGTGDGVVPMTGRPIGSAYRQGDVRYSIDTLAQANQCPAARQITPADSELSCQDWSGCGNGGGIQLCLHDGGHIRPPGWFDRAADWWGLKPLNP
ncbi:MAG: hypothetical protein KI792_09535 [Alphaproteobacteria bacterium]|nr:hypothetical protein [Alphaproteobacteria bacterium SS10]